MCLTKLLVSALKKRFHKLSRAEKMQVRELVNSETKSDTTEKQKKQVKRRAKKMAETEEVKKEEVEETSKQEEKGAEVVEDAKTEEKAIEETKEEPKEEPVEVQQTEPTGNGVRVEDLVTKDELAERLSAFEAKFEALTKENMDLKEELSKAKEQVAGMKDKYEKSDFGNEQKQGVMSQDKKANDTFAEYAKKFI